MSSNSVQKEISAMVKKKCFALKKFYYAFYFSATRNQCNGETEISL
jgi:hypothetical protein